MSCKYFGHRVVLAILCLLLLILPGSSVNARKPNDPPEHPQVLTLPFSDFRVHVRNGWQSHIGSPACGSSRRCYGIDYVLDNNGWQSFDVFAAHDGQARAMCGAGIGDFVKIDYVVENEDGTESKLFRTYYGHLATIAAHIPRCEADDPATEDIDESDPAPVGVRAGEQIGTAGATGVTDSKGIPQPTWIHLHFAVYDRADTPDTFDPYMLITSADSKYYPNRGTTGTLGDNHYWSTNPPSYPDQAQMVIVTPGNRPLDAGGHTNPDAKPDFTIRAPNGLEFGDFTVTIGGRQAGISSVANTSSGVYDLEVIPPTQPEPGLYDLEITGGGYSAKKVEALEYTVGDLKNLDVMLVIDHSGSMAGQPITDARNAAEQFVTQMQDEDAAGVVGFSYRATLYHPLSALTSDTRDSLIARIQGIQANGGTSIGSGIETATTTLVESQSLEHNQTIVLLSDGQENRRPWVRDVLQDVIDADIVLHSISLGPNADQTLMETTATDTGGEHFHAPSSEDLATIYLDTRARVAGEQILFNQEGTVIQGQMVEQQVTIDPFTSTATFLINWPGSDLDLALITPDGTTIDPNVAAVDPNIEFVSSGLMEFYRAAQPGPGIWTMQITGVDVEETIGESFTARVTGRSLLTMTTHLDREQYVDHEPIQISAALSDEAPITDADVQAQVRTASDHTVDIVLLDNGVLPDHHANDGIYTALFSDTSVAGSYTILVGASGLSTQGDTFSRSASASALVVQSAQPRFDLEIEGSGPESVRPWQEFIYSIQYRNLGPDEADNVVVALQLPDGLRYVSDDSGFEAVLPTDDMVTWSVGELATSELGQFTITLSADFTGFLDSQETAQMFVDIGSESESDLPTPVEANRTNNSSLISTPVSPTMYIVIGVGVLVILVGVVVWLVARGRQATIL